MASSFTASPRRFLTAEWRSLLMLNFEVDPAVVQPFIPGGTVLDFWNGRTYLSIVGFYFARTRVLGVPIPWHCNFEEVNLRFYVRRAWDGEERRGVVFIKEIVPRWAIAWVARTVYNENYVALPMRGRFTSPGQLKGQAAYEWYQDGRWHGVAADIAGTPQPSAPRSEAEFITEHYWGYARQRNGGTVEYGVEHPRWRVWQATGAQLDCDVTRVYGEQFGASLAGTPTSAFVAEGSPIVVRQGRRIWSPSQAIMT